MPIPACPCPHHPLGEGPGSEQQCRVDRELRWSHPSKGFQTSISHTGEICFSLITLHNLNFCIQDFGLNTYSWIHILFAGWLCYACIRGFFPFQLGRKPCKGKKHAEKWKLLLWLLCSVSATCWKNTSQYQAAQRKKSCVYKTAGCWSTEQLCNLIQFVTFYHLPLPISPRCLAWGSTGTKFIPLASSNWAFPFMSSLQSTGLLESTGLLLPLGSATTDSAPFPESKRHIGRELRHKTESWDINNFTWGLLKARRGLKLSGVSWSKR